MLKSDTAKPYKYDGPASKADVEGHIYVAEFDQAGIKVGMTGDPTSRIRQHQRYGDAFGHPLARTWVSAPHVEWRQNEHRLIAFCQELAGVEPQSSKKAGEYFGLDYDLVRELAISLPCTKGQKPRPHRSSAELAAATIRGKRAALQLHQEDLAVVLGISASSLARLETGARDISVNELLTVCGALDIGLADLFAGLPEEDLRTLGLL